MGLVLSPDATASAAAPPLVAGRSWVRPTSPTRAMSAPLLPEVQLRSADAPQPALPLASEGVLRCVWHSRYGDMLIEVLGEDVLVNGQRVERHQG